MTKQSFTTLTSAFHFLPGNQKVSNGFTPMTMNVSQGAGIEMEIDNLLYLSFMSERDICLH